jgi:hypothetical protein
MIITRESILTGKTNQLDLPVTLEQIQIWQSGTPIQNVMSHLSIQEREFLITGMSKEEQQLIFN